MTIMAAIKVPCGVSELDQVRALMRAFVRWHRQRHAADLARIDQYFDASHFEAELAGLPGAYAQPSGILLLATDDGRPAGCVALRPLGGHACEMKRMFVYPHLQGKGIGLALGQSAIEYARAAGYRKIRLDTSIQQDEAIGLYSRMGFLFISPYYPLPADLSQWLVFMELQLASPGATTP